jgi:chromosome segregation ATPase
METTIQLVLGIGVALAGGGLFGAWFTHNRDLPKARAEARNMDWLRFQTEIDRLDKKVAAQDTKIDNQEMRIAELEHEVATCHITKEQQAIQLAKQESEISELQHRLCLAERSTNG